MSIGCLNGGWGLTLVKGPALSITNCWIHQSQCHHTPIAFLHFRYLPLVRIAAVAAAATALVVVVVTTAAAWHFNVSFCKSFFLECFFRAVKRSYDICVHPRLFRDALARLVFSLSLIRICDWTRNCRESEAKFPLNQKSLIKVKISFCDMDVWI